MEELKPCKCGSVDIHEEVMSDNKSHIACQVCGFEIITDYPEWSFELWNTRAKEVIMSEPLKLSKVLGLKPLIPSEGFSQDWEDGYELALYRLDQRSPDVEELARIIYEQQYNRNININSRCPDWKKEAPYVKERFVLLAQEIINKMSVWVVKKT